MFLLLQKEAEKNGITVSDESLASMLGEVQIQLEDRVVLFQNLGDDNQMADEVRASVRAFLLVYSSFGDGMDKIKVSQPLLDNRRAKFLQEIKLNLTEFAARDYTDKVAPPTPEQIQAQFNKYADILSSEADPKTNPFAFGYKYPDRLKVAYIAISPDEVRKAVKASKTDYDWEVDAQKYYKRNPSLFATTQPASTEPTSMPSNNAFSLTSTPKATTKPFSEVKDSIVADLVAPDADKMMENIEAKLTTQMREDWNAFHAASTASPPPSTMPASSVGISYDSPDYLPKLAAQIQQQFKVVPSVALLSEKFLAEDDLKALPGIGGTMLEIPAGRMAFSTYAIAQADSFGNAKAENGEPFKLLEPSRPATDPMTDTTYFFRITAADPSHKPADSRDVLQQIEDDLQTARTYDLAKADATKLLDAAKTSSLRVAALGAKKNVISTSYFGMAPGELPTDVPISSLSQPAFLDQAFDLLSAAAQKKSTIELISLPRDKKIQVAELADVRPNELATYMAPQLPGLIINEFGKDIFKEWFNFDSLVKRVNFVDTTKKKETTG